jgi:hypothetical protein
MMFDMHQIILPTPQPPFAWRQSQTGPALVCREVELYARHLFTTRQWALGSEPIGEPSRHDTGWEDVADAVQVSSAMLARARQVHGCRVLIAESGPEPLSAADIIITHDVARAVAVQAADCAPLLIVDRGTGAVAAAHAGWRGMALRVPAATVQALVRTYGSRPSDLIAAVGPSIGACCYEVGQDVRDRFSEGQFDRGQVERWFLERPMSCLRNPPFRHLPRDPRPYHWFFDGWTAVREQLNRAGVPAEQIFVAELCTASHPDAFCSFRRDGPPAGRMAGAIRPRPLRP